MAGTSSMDSTERPEGSDTDWQHITKVMVDEMERHARAILSTANLAREQLGLGTVLQVRHVPVKRSRDT